MAVGANEIGRRVTVQANCPAGVRPRRSAPVNVVPVKFALVRLKPAKLPPLKLLFDNVTSDKS